MADAPLRKAWLLAWIFPFGLGFLGFIASKSATSTLATSMSLALIWDWLRRARFSRKPVVLTIGLGLALALIYFLRIKDVRELSRLERGSFAHRLMLGYAGLLIFSKSSPGCGLASEQCTFSFLDMLFTPPLYKLQRLWPLSRATLLIACGLGSLCGGLSCLLIW